MMETVLEILKYTIPAIVVLIATSLIVKRFLNTELKKKQLKMLIDNQEITVRLRLQACERLIMFIERVNPRQLVPRVYQSGMTVADLQAAIIYNVKAEFEHNLSQQIYVSKPVWDIVRGVQEQMIHMTGTMAKQLQPDAPAQELHAKIIEFLVSSDGQMPMEVALNLINDEAKDVLMYGAQHRNSQ